MEHHDLYFKELVMNLKLHLFGQLFFVHDTVLRYVVFSIILLSVVES